MKALPAFTDEEKYALLELSYVDLPAELSAALPITVGQWINSSHPAPQEKQLWDRIRADPNVAALTILAYQNDNPSLHPGGSGFVGYALRDAEDNGAVLFRGSEQNTLSDALADWGSNLTAALGLTIRQQRQADAFYRSYLHLLPGEHILMGHSKGGNLAAYVYTQNLDADPSAYVVNGQPIYWLHLNNVQRDALRAQPFEFIVHRGDLVSTLGYVDYIKRIVDIREDVSEGSFAAHRLESAVFNADGQLITLYEGITIPRLLLSAASISLLYVLEKAGLEESEALIALFDTAITAAIYVLGLIYRNLHQSARECIHTCRQQLDGSYKLSSRIEPWLTEVMNRGEKAQTVRSAPSVMLDQSGLPELRSIAQARRLHTLRDRLWQLRSRLRTLQAQYPNDAFLYAGAFQQIENALHAQQQALTLLRQGGEKNA